MFNRSSISEVVRRNKSDLLIIATFLFLSVPAWAADDTAVVSAAVKAKIVVDSPEEIVFAPLDPGEIAYTDPFDVLVSSNRNWQLDVSASNGGKLALPDGTPLTNPLLIRKGFTYVSMITQTNMMSGSKPSGTLNTNLMQITLYYDSPGDYSTTLTFVATQT